MKWRCVSLVLIAFFSSRSFSQSQPTLLEIRSAYESFEYQKVITLAERFLSQSDSLNNDVFVEVSVMKAVSHYTLAEEKEARRCFQEIVLREEDFSPDPKNISPKIIHFFEEVKKDFQQKTVVQENFPLKKIDSLRLVPHSRAGENDYFRDAFVRSLLVPGWGHLYVSNSTKGLIISATTIATAGTLIYFIFDTRAKENTYLRERNLQRIESRYKEFNTSYAIRNALIVAYGAIWLYAQADLAFFSFDNILTESTLSLKILPSPTSPISVQLSFQILD